MKTGKTRTKFDSLWSHPVYVHSAVKIQNTGLPLFHECPKFEKLYQKVSKMSGIFCDVVSGDSPYFGFSVQFEKKESHVK